MKKTYSYFIIRRYEKRILFSAKFVFALLLATVVQISAYGVPVNGHNLLHSNKGLPTKLSPAKAELSDIKVTGKITDASGEGLIGATIGLKGGANLGVADVNGNFAVTVPDNATLVISYIGYQTQEVAVGGRTQINIVLKAANGNLNEVVVVGYTTQRKKDL